MLVLARKPGEKIIIKVLPSDEVREIIIDVTRITELHARIGITAPQTIIVTRDELVKKVEQK